jgi:hypothetical protein
VPFLKPQSSVIKRNPMAPSGTSPFKALVRELTARLPVSMIADDLNNSTSFVSSRSLSSRTELESCVVPVVVVVERPAAGGRRYTSAR